MEFEAVDEGTIARIVVPEGAGNVKVGTVIAVLAEEGENPGDISTPDAAPEPKATPKSEKAPAKESEPAPAPRQESAPSKSEALAGDRVKASPLARRLAGQKGPEDRKSVGWGTRVSVRVDLDWARVIKKKNPQ